MDRKTFWNIVEGALIIPQEKKLSNKEQLEFIVERLLCCQEDEIIDYHRNFRELLGAIRNTSIHQVGVIIEGYLNSDAFEWFCTGIIYKGEEVYANVIRNPDNLADYVEIGEDTTDYENITKVADHAFIKKRKNKELDMKVLELPSEIHSLAGLDLWEDIHIFYKEEELMSKYPKTWNKFWVRYNDNQPDI